MSCGLVEEGGSGARVGMDWRPKVRRSVRIEDLARFSSVLDPWRLIAKFDRLMKERLTLLHCTWSNDTQQISLYFLFDPERKHSSALTPHCVLYFTITPFLSLTSSMALWELTCPQIRRPCPVQQQNKPQIRRLFLVRTKRRGVRNTRDATMTKNDNISTRDIELTRHRGFEVGLFLIHRFIWHIKPCFNIKPPDI